MHQQQSRWMLSHRLQTKTKITQLSWTVFKKIDFACHHTCNPFSSPHVPRILLQSSWPIETAVKSLEGHSKSCCQTLVLPPVARHDDGDGDDDTVRSHSQYLVPLESLASAHAHLCHSDGQCSSSSTPSGRYVSIKPTYFFCFLKSLGSQYNVWVNDSSLHNVKNGNWSGQRDERWH